MNELFQIQPQWARAHYLRSNPLAIGVEMPDRPIRAERPFTPLLLLLAIVYLMAVLTPTSASAARLDSAEALAAWAKSKNWTKTSYGIGYKSDKIGSFDIWIVYDRTLTLIPFNESWLGSGRDPEAVTRTGENITIAGGIPATRRYLSIVRTASGGDRENWEYYCHDYRVLMRAHRDPHIGQVGSDPLALFENYIAFVNKYLNVKPLSIGKTGKEDLHEIKITGGPQGSANPAFPGRQIECIVAAQDSLGHELKYKWTALGAALGFNAPTLKRPTWTVQPNDTGNMVYWPIAVEVSCDHGASAKGHYIQKVWPRDKVALGYIMTIMGSKDGTIERLKSAKDQSGEKLKKGAVIYNDDILITHNVMVKIILDYYQDNPLVVMKSNTKIRLEKKVKYKKGGLMAFFGKLFFKGNGKDHRGFKIVTSNAIAGIEDSMWEDHLNYLRWLDQRSKEKYLERNVRTPLERNVREHSKSISYEVDYDPTTSQTTVSAFEGIVRLDCIKGKAGPVMVNAGMQATMDSNCNHTLSILDPDKNTTAKAGWDVDTEPNDIGTQPPQTGSSVTGSGTGSGGGTAQGTAWLLTAKSNRDMVGRNEKFRGNGKTDAIFRAQFSAPNRMVTAVEVSNTNGIRSVWDTRPNNRLWLGGVVIGGRTMNHSDGSVNFNLGSGQNSLDFFVEDNGSIRGGKTNYRMTIFFVSGDPVVMNIIPGGGSPGSYSSSTQTGTQHPPGDITKTTGTGPTGLTLDFETGRTNGWTKTGTAFDHQPTYGDNPTARHRGQPSKHIGNYWVGTYEKYQGSGSQKPGSVQGDGPTGTLTSNVFTIPAGSLSFLVGGGSSSRTRVELLVSGNSVLSVSGRNTETMHRVKWDLNPWAGQQGQLRIVDNASGGWGHINADDFRFSHSGGGSGGAAQGTARLLTASSNRDMVGRNEMYRGNGTNDAIFRAQFSAPNRTVTAVEVSNTNGLRSVWDTRPNNRLWLGGVVIGGRTMNRSDGSVNFSLGSGQNTLDFFVEDNGSIRGRKTNYRMTIFFASGDPLVMNITPGGGGPGSSGSNTQTGTQHPVGDITKTTGTGSQKPGSIQGDGTTIKPWLHAPGGDFSKAHRDEIINYITWDNTKWTAKVQNGIFIHAPNGDFSKAHKDNIINYITWNNTKWTAKIF